MVPGAIRSNVIASLKGVFSNVLRTYLRLHLFGPNGLETAGLPIVIKGEMFLLKAKVVNMITDGDGWRLALDWKGAASMKPCFKHRNVLMKDSGLTHRREGFVEISCAEPDKFECATPDDIADNIGVVLLAHERMLNGEMTKARFEKMTMALGFNANRLGLLNDTLLRSAFNVLEVMTYDWVHTTLQDGSISVDTYHLIEACAAINISVKDLEAFLKCDLESPKQPLAAVAAMAAAAPHFRLTAAAASSSSSSSR
jgi:hypothetical protein